ncbi:MAG: SixA phosphatase family protein [Bacteroidota bacterium]|jgi:phosphohistidine phosphatase
MKKIILMRHAKSSWENPWMEDYDRPLAERGVLDATKMAKALKNRGVIPQLLLSSPALRTMETAKITSKILGIPEEQIIYEKSLYHASPSQLLKAIHHQKDSVDTLLLLGHNPGLTELIQELGVQIDNLPTSGQLGFTLAASRWEEFKAETVSFWFVDYPKKAD